MSRMHDHHHHANGTHGPKDEHGPQGEYGLRGEEPARAVLGHNHAHAARGVAQWQLPHLDETAQSDQAGRSHEHGEPDLDKVEQAFVHGFTTSADPTSFLRLARVPFEAAVDGKALVLLRVETDCVVDVGSVMPHLGGGSFRYDPLPGPLATKRQRLRFVYFDGTEIRTLSFAETRALVATASG